MRKLAFLTAATFVLSTLSAQTTFGFQFGVNLANMTASTSGVSVSLNSKAGIHGGFFFTIPSAKNFSIQPEIVYSIEGANYKPTNNTIHLNYINLPVMFQYNANGFLLEAGPQIGVLLSAKEDGVNATSGYENMNVSLGMGAAYRLKSGVGFGARYNLGLTSVVKNAGQDASVKGNVWQFGLTFSLAQLVRK